MQASLRTRLGLALVLSGAWAPVAMAGMGFDVAMGQRHSAWAAEAPGQITTVGRETALQFLWAPLEALPVALTGGYTVVSFADRGHAPGFDDFTGTETSLGLHGWLRLAPVVTSSLAYERVIASRYQYTAVDGGAGQGTLKGAGQAFSVMVAWELLPLAHLFLKGRWQAQSLDGEGGDVPATSLVAWQGRRVEEKSQSFLAGFGLRL